MPRHRFLAVATTVLLIPLAACTPGEDDDAGTPAPLGAVVPTLGFEIEGRASYVVVPGRRYDFLVSTPRDSLGSSAASDAGYDAEVGDGRAVIGVSWSLDLVPGEAGLAMAPRDLPITATLVVDGERSDLGDLRAEGGNGAYVVVPDDVDDVGLEVEYDAKTQVLDDVYDPVTRRPSGLNALYNDSPVLATPSCPDTPRDTDGLFWPGARCTVGITSPVLYYGPVGWAPAGSEWVVARVTVSGATLAGVDVPGGYVSYDVTGGEARVTLDGREPVEVLPLEQGEPAGLDDDGDWRGVAVFRVDESDTPRDLLITRRYQAVAEDTDEATAAGQPRVRTLRDRVVVPVP